MSYPILAAQNTWYKSSTAKSTITQINIVDTYTPTGNETESWNADVDNTGSVKCYRTGTVLTIAGNGSGKIACNADSFCLFSDDSSVEASCFISVTAINGANILDTSSVITMRKLFSLCLALASIDVSTWNTNNVTDMYGMFQGCIKLKSLNLSGWDVSKVTTFSHFAFGHSSVGNMEITTFGDLSNWRLTSATDCNAMFHRCTSLTFLNVSNFGMNNVTDMGYMFYMCNSLQSLDVSNWNTSNCTDMSYLFYKCNSMTTLDVSKWNTSSCTNMKATFLGCRSLTTLDVSNWDVSSCTTMHNMFGSGQDWGGGSIESLDVSKWNLSSCTDMGWMFYGQEKLTTLNVRKWDVSKVESFHHMFAWCTQLIPIGIENWKPSNALYMNAMFHGCAHTSIDLSGWDVSKVQTFAQMFENNFNLKEIKGLDKWNTSACRAFQEMFIGCTHLEELDLSSFDTRNASVNWLDPIRNDGSHGEMTNMFSGMRRIKKIRFGKNFKFDGDGTCTKITPPSVGEDVENRDGSWYTAKGEELWKEIIPEGVAATYFGDPTELEEVLLIKNKTLYRIADAIRAAYDLTGAYTPEEMAVFIESLINS